MPDTEFTRYKLAFPAWMCYIILLVAAGGILLYLAAAISTFAGFLHYRRFDGIRTLQQSTGTSIHHEDALQAIRAAIASDSNQALYSAALGKYLLEHTMAETLPNTPSTVAGNTPLQEAEELLQDAIGRDPANPWSYYDFGRLSYHRGDCASSLYQISDSCPTVRYYQTALRNYSKNLFLRQEIGGWWLRHDWDRARQFIQRLVAQDLEEPLISGTAEQAKKFAQFLYAIPMDYESDRELSLSLKAQKKYVEACDDVVMPVQSAQAYESGSDDGTADWNTPLTEPEQRVRKLICLPNDLSPYRAASLKIMMSSGGGGSVRPRIFCNDVHISTIGLNVGLMPAWHEIPIDIRMLPELSSASVYIRIPETSSVKHALRIWGDQQMTTIYSVLNMKNTTDLSPTTGTQTGEYMIRLVLYR